MEIYFVFFFPPQKKKKETPPTLQHICKPARADAQTKGLQKSCNFADTHEAIMKGLSVFLQYGRCA
ncbi:MAG: hypothetical protein M0Q12_03050 [Synergistaceae bacterium]|jgi:hypothetical protein|nr:hypothetical protein [Synergistaceae bacterium]